MTTEKRYVVLKLVSGEQLLAICQEENILKVIIQNPMVIKTTPTIHPISGRAVENVSACPWSSFTENKVFDIDRSKLLFLKEMHPLIVKQYDKMVEAYEQEVLVKQNSDGYLEVIEEKETNTEPQTIEELYDSIDSYEEELEEEPNPDSIYVSGNRTLN